MKVQGLSIKIMRKLLNLYRFFYDKYFITTHLVSILDFAMIKITFTLLLYLIGMQSALSQFDQAFDKYPVKAEKVKPKILVLDQQSRKYRTLLTEMSSKPFNFSNHFVAETYGCGGGCSGLLVFNAKTGRGLLMKEQFSDCYTQKHGFTQNDIFFEKNSRLIVAVGTRTGEQYQCEQVHYVIEKDQFKQIKQKWLYK